MNYFMSKFKNCSFWSIVVFNQIRFPGKSVEIAQLHRGFTFFLLLQIAVLSVSHSSTNQIMERCSFCRYSHFHVSLHALEALLYSSQTNNLFIFRFHSLAGHSGWLLHIANMARCGARQCFCFVRADTCNGILQRTQDPESGRGQPKIQRW